MPDARNGADNRGVTRQSATRSSTYRSPHNSDTFAFIASNQRYESSNAMDSIGRLDPKTGQVIEYPFPFPYSQISMKQLRLDPRSWIWWVSDSNNKVGSFYLAGSESPYPA
jgi:streptogramin lyase